VPNSKPGFVAQIKSYPAVFWIANTMEIFERMAWYGFYAVASLYITGPKETGGLGFNDVQRGQIQAIVPFFLYIFPVFTGALADRYGYKKMFTIAYVGMVISYYLLGQATTMPGFLAAFMLVAVAAAIFKPVVVGTVARLTDETNSSTGFGIFYMMVNIGGFVGPIVAGAVRGVSWDYVFIACSCWAAVNLIIVLLFYKDPTTEAGSKGARTFRKVMDDTVEVLGNLRLFVTVFVVLIALMLPGFRWEWFTWTHCWVFIGCWIVLNVLWDLAMPAGSGRPDYQGGGRRNPLLKRMHCSNWRFALFLLIMSGFWTSFNQIFLTMPLYIRDFTDTRAMVNMGRRVFGALGRSDWIDKLAAIEETELFGEFDRLVRRARGLESMVPPEPLTGEELAKKGKEVAKDLERLLKSPQLSEVDRTAAADFLASLALLDAKKYETLFSLSDEAQTLLGAIERSNKNLAPTETFLLFLSGLRQKWENALLKTIDEARALLTAVDRAKRIPALAFDPSLTDEDRAALARLVVELNAPAAATPLEVLDLVEGARTILQYKVRIEPTELGELMASIPTSPQAITNEQLDVAVKTINTRLNLKGKDEFEDAEADAVRAVLSELMAQGPLPARQAVVEACATLSAKTRELEPANLALGVRDLSYRAAIWERMDAGRQVNPEHIVNFDAGAIVLLQVLISFLMARFHRFTTMIVGMVVAGVGIGLSAVAGGTMIGPVGGLLCVVIAGIVIFGIGEMMASPTSQEYVGRIAPRDKVALYMGYYFVAVALGNLFGGILSGEMYQKLARDVQRPDLMWLFYGGLMFLTALIFLLYNKFALPREAVPAMTGGSSSD